MDLVLSPVEIRVLGSMIEKELATPAYYPLTLNAVVAACNQKSNRDPGMTLDETTVVRALDTLRYDRHLASQVSSSGSRVPKYRHELLARYNFTPDQVAVLCELFVRGPQTVGELRTHASRFTNFEDTAKVEATLSTLMAFQDGPVVVQLSREPGRREPRWAHLFGGEVKVDAEPASAQPESARLVVMAENERIAALEQKVAGLTLQLDDLKKQFADLRMQLGDRAPDSPAPGATHASQPSP